MNIKKRHAYVIHVRETLRNVGPVILKLPTGRPFKTYVLKNSIRFEFVEKRAKKPRPPSVGEDRFKEWAERWFFTESAAQREPSNFRNKNTESKNGRYLVRFFQWFEDRYGPPDGGVPKGPDFERDERRSILRLIPVRSGQGGFRRALLDAYDERCAISGCKVPETLQAAHIIPYPDSLSNVIGNGILLRADWHLLFDSGLVRIDEKFVVHVDAAVTEPGYRKADGRGIRLPSAMEDQPHLAALQWRLKNR